MQPGGVLRLWVVAPTAGMHAFTNIAKHVQPGVNTTHDNLKRALYTRECTHEQHTVLLAAVFNATTRYDAHLSRNCCQHIRLFSLIMIGNAETCRVDVTQGLQHEQHISHLLTQEKVLQWTLSDLNTILKRTDYEMATVIGEHHYQAHEAFTANLDRWSAIDAGHAMMQQPNTIHQIYVINNDAQMD
jgi:hypothetical protein